jgi:hypothetical protein
MNQANLRCLGHSVSVGAKERTTMTLKEKIVAKVAGCGMNCDPSEIADRILEIPELKEALEWVAARRDMLYGGGTGFVRVERIPPDQVYMKPKD